MTSCRTVTALMTARPTGGKSADNSIGCIVFAEIRQRVLIPKSLYCDRILVW
jgi:hypothetical protein